MENYVFKNRPLVNDNLLVANFKQYLNQIGSKDLGQRLTEAAVSYRTTLPSGLLTSYYDHSPLWIADMVEKFGLHLADCDIPPDRNDEAELIILEEAFQKTFLEYLRVVDVVLEIIQEAYSHIGQPLKCRSTIEIALGKNEEDFPGLLARSSSYYIRANLISCQENSDLNSFVKHLHNLPAAIRSDLVQIAVLYGRRSGTIPVDICILHPKRFRENAERLAVYPHTPDEINEVTQALIRAGENIIASAIKKEDRQTRISDALDSICRYVFLDISQLSYFASEQNVVPKFTFCSKSVLDVA